jgi:hypothetical protein
VHPLTSDGHLPATPVGVSLGTSFTYRSKWE